MKRYRFYIDSRSFPMANLQRILTYLFDLSWMMVQRDGEIPEDFMHPDAYNLLAVNDKDGKDVAQEIWGNPDLEVQNVVVSILGRISPVKKTLSSIDEMDDLFKDSRNAFTGPLFKPCTDRHVTTREEYIDFKTRYPVVRLPLWKRRDSLYKKVRFCDGVEKEIDKKPGFWNTVTDRISCLNDFALNHWHGNFTPAEFQKHEGRNLKDETPTTLNNPEVRRQRNVVIEGIGSVCASLHFPIGDMRMNVYPDEANKIFYISYFGTHLKTKNYKG